MHASGKPTHIMPPQSRQARSKIARRTAKKFCNDFRGDAQALGLTRGLLPRTMRHRFEECVVVPEIKTSVLALQRGSWYKSEEKANIKPTSHAC
jgi:hypothetical protein